MLISVNTYTAGTSNVNWVNLLMYWTNMSAMRFF